MLTWKDEVVIAHFDDDCLLPIAGEVAIDFHRDRTDDFSHMRTRIARLERKH